MTLSRSFGEEKGSEIATRMKPVIDAKHVTTGRTGDGKPRREINMKDEMRTRKEGIRYEDEFHASAKIPVQQLLMCLDVLVDSVSDRSHCAFDSDGTHQNDTEEEQTRSDLLAHVILRSSTTLFESFCLQSNWMKDQIDFWYTIEHDRLAAISYLIQTFPGRCGGLVDGIWRHTIRSIDSKRQDGHSMDHELRSQEASNQVRPSISIRNLFPILSTNLMGQSGIMTGLKNRYSKQFLHLTRQEARVKRKALQAAHLDLVEKIGRLVRCLKKLEDHIEQPVESGHTLVEMVEEMIQLTCRLETRPRKCIVGVKSGELLVQLHQLLSTNLPNQDKDLRLVLSPYSPPGFLTRNWPWFISLPIISYSISTLASKYRSKILVGLKDAQETIKGFISGWVVRPIEDIIQTLKAGQKGSLAIMTKDSLSSELDSLERMAVDFARDKFHWTHEQLSELSESVKVGNLTSVLKVWEQEIKNPVRSAIAGSLIRVLLIQIQKVKVDLSLAMDGIQSILRSQSLTFGAIGVAPSMLICFMLGKLFNSIIKQRIGVVGKGTKVIRKEVRMAMRRIDRTLLLITSNPSDDSNHSITKSHMMNPERTLGHLFLDLNLMRYFAHSSHFPSRESSRSIRKEFIDDVKDLESFQLSWKTKSKLAKRFIKRWGCLVGI